MADTYSDIKNVVSDWLQGEGSAVADLELNLINRAKDYIARYRHWDELKKRLTLTLDSDGKTVTNYPNDIQAIIEVGLDTDGDGRLDYFFFLDDYEPGRGYYLESGWTKAAGHSWTMKFNDPPSGSPVLIYQMKLTDFEGTGTEYSFYPKELMIKTAQKLFIEDSGAHDEYGVIDKAFREQMRDYESLHQYQNTAMKMVPLDNYYNAVEFDGNALDKREVSRTTEFEPDVDDYHL